MIFWILLLAPESNASPASQAVCSSVNQHGFLPGVAQ
jgi:hypothetical protein